MVDTTSVEIPKPLNWQDFQRGCVILFRGIVRDDRLQEYGRAGQLQNGIDLLGLRDRDPNRPVGIQCRRIAQPLTEKAMRADVREARHIKPSLVELIFATTSSRDKSTQETAALLTQELHRSGWPCRVTVMAWEDLQLEIARDPDALRMFMPAALSTPAPPAESASAAGLSTKIDEQTALLHSIVESVGRRAVLPEQYDSDLEPDAQSEPASLHARISVLRDLLQEGKTKTAIQGLEKLLAVAPSPPPYAKYRITANIGAAHFHAGRYIKAAEYWSEALALRPNDPKAQTNVALAELACGHIAQAAGRSREVLRVRPDYGPAASVLIQAYTQDSTLEDPEAVLSEKSRASADVCVAILVAKRMRGDSAWRELARQARAAHPENPSLVQFETEAELEPVLAESSVPLGARIDAALLERVRMAVPRLKEIWRSSMDEEEPNPDAIIPLTNNVASALRFFGEQEAAAQVLDAAMASVGSNPLLARSRAIIYLENGEADRALDLLSVSDAGPTEKLLRAEVLSGKDPKLAQGIVDDLVAAGLSQELLSTATTIRAEIQLALRDWDGVRASLLEMQRLQCDFLHIELVRTRAAAAKSSDSTNEPPEDADEEETEADDPRLPVHVQRFAQIVQQRQAELSFSDRVQAAMYLEETGAFEIASDLLHEQVALDRNTLGLRTYLRASIGANLNARAETALANVPPSIAQLPFFQRSAATLYWNVGAADRALPLVKELYERSPDNLQLFLWYVDVLVRLNKITDLDQLISQPVENRLSGTVVQKSRLASVLSHFGQPERALAFAYRLFAFNQDVPAVWMAFMSAMLIAGKSDRLDLLSQTVAADFVVDVEDPDRAAKRYLIETDDEVRRVLPDAYPPTHEVPTAMLRLTAGDQFCWPFGGGLATVRSVKHKYLERFHAAMDLFNERFPEAKGLQRVKVNFEAEQGGLDEVKAMLRARSEHIAAQAKLYSEGMLSLPMLAMLTGADPIETMLGLAEINVPYKVAIGAAAERNNALEAIDRNAVRGCVVDSQTLYCIRRLKLEEVVQKVCGPIGVTQATIDIFRSRVQLVSALGGGRAGNMRLRGDQVELVESTEAQRQQIQQTLEDDLKWIGDTAKVLPAQAVTDAPRAVRQLGSVRGARFFDDVYAANGSSRLLVSDDLFTRQIASHLSIGAAWLQPVLMLAHADGMLSEAEYARAITDLIDIGQQRIAVNTTLLLGARELDFCEGQPRAARRIELASRPFGGLNADPASHCKVVAEFLVDLWSSSQPISVGDQAITSTVLTAVLKERHSDYQKLLSRIDLLVSRLPALGQYLREWAKGHFLQWPQLAITASTA
jgi:cellulose synthase operon protein C